MLLMTGGPCAFLGSRLRGHGGARHPMRHYGLPLSLGGRCSLKRHDETPLIFAIKKHSPANLLGCVFIAV